MGKETLPQGEVDALIKEFETKLGRLKNTYEQYFMGMERVPPNTQRKEVVRLAQRLDNLYTQSTAGRFRIRAVVQRYNTYKIYWNRTCKQIEEGTYVRDIQRARRNQKNREDRENAEAKDSGQPIGQAADGAFDLDFDLDLNSIDLGTFLEEPKPASMPEKPMPAVPKAAAPALASLAAAEPTPRPMGDDRAAKLARLKRKIKPSDSSKIRGASVDSTATPSSSPAALKAARIKATKEKLAKATQRNVPTKEDGEARSVFNALLAAKRKCNEPTANLNYETLRDSLSKQKQHLKKTRGAKSVEFNVVIKDGKAFLKPDLKK